MRAADRAGNSQSYAAGLRLGIPIALGYFSVSMAYGLSAVVLGFRPLQAALISISNLTSAGQFAGTQIIAQHGQLAELVLTTLVINARYFLMALSLSQKLEKTSLLQRLVMAYGITDELHQAFVPGRLCDPADWLTDTLGASLGATLAAILVRGGGRREKNSFYLRYFRKRVCFFERFSRIHFRYGGNTVYDS